MSVIFETQKAVYTKLTSNAPLMAKVEGVFDHVPDSSEYPYITIGELVVVDDSVKGAKGYEIDLALHIYSRATGRKELLEIIEMCRNLLDGQALAVTGFTHIMNSFVSAETELNKDGVTRHGKILFKVRVR